MHVKVVELIAYKTYNPEKNMLIVENSESTQRCVPTLSKYLIMGGKFTHNLTEHFDGHLKFKNGLVLLVIFK